MSDIAMSTSWRIRRVPTLGSTLDAIAELGLSLIELNALTPAQMAELPNELARRGMQVQSLHDPCPWPADAEGAYLPRRQLGQLSFLDDEARAQAIDQAKTTIAWAERLGAQAVVIHLGRVEMPNQQSRLFELLSSGEGAAFAALRDQETARREALKGPYLEHALASIRELGAYAERAGVALGVEVRDAYHEIPSLAEFEQVFAATEGLPVYYWHDTGHAHKQETLGLARQEDYLRRFRQRLLGIHLHDAVLDRDHLAPGDGVIDLGAVARLLPPGTLLTLELNTGVTLEEARRGLALLQTLGFD